MSYTESETATATLVLQGVWVHDPLDAQTTARQYRYGGPPGQMTTETPDSAALYAGREFPMVDYSPHRTEDVQVSMVVPFGPDWSRQIEDAQALARARRSLTYRDGRGRNVTGRFSDYSERDERHGTTVSLRVSRSVA